MADTDASAWQALAGESGRELAGERRLLTALVARHGSAVLLPPAELRAVDPGRLARTEGPEGIRLWIKSGEARDG
jgi:hypothetical protein